MNPPLRLGRWFFAAAIIAFGVQQLVKGAFVTRAMPEWPAGVPGAGVWPYLFGLLFIACGIAIALGNALIARRAALITALIIFAGALFLHVPRALADPPMWGMLWTLAGKGLVLGGGALVVAASLSSPDLSANEIRLAATGRILLGAFLLLAGVEHFIFAQFVQQLVPAWIPGHLFWTYISGAALIAGGIGLLLPPTARIAAWLVAAMIFSWVLLLHIPRATANLGDANETTAVFEALAFCGIAVLLATLLTRKPRAPLAA